MLTWDARTEPPPAALLEADVVLEGFRPGVWERLNVTLPETTILCSITGFGADGLACRSGGPRPQLPRLRRSARGHRAGGASGADRRPRGRRAGSSDRGARRAARARADRPGRQTHDLDDPRIPPVRRAPARWGPGRASAYGRGRLLPDLRDGGPPLPDGRGARAQVLAPPLRAARAPGPRGPSVRPELPELDALFRTRTMREWLDLLEHEDTCVGPVLSLAESAAELCEAGRDRLRALRDPRRASPHDSRWLRARVEPQRGAHRLRTRGDLWVADADGTHRARLVARADQPAWGPNGRRLAFVRDGWVWTIRADGLDERKLAPGAHPTGRRTVRASPSTGTARPTRRSGGTAARRRTPAPAPIPPTPPTDGWRSSPTDRSRSTAASSHKARRRTGRPTDGLRGCSTG